MYNICVSVYRYISVYIYMYMVFFLLFKHLGWTWEHPFIFYSLTDIFLMPYSTLCTIRK